MTLVTFAPPTTRGSRPTSGACEGTTRLASLGAKMLIMFLTTCLTGAAFAQTTPIAVIGDDPTNGILDPSVEYDPTNGDGWLAYSAIFGTLLPWGPHVESHIARSLDGGSTWTFETVAAPSTVDQLVNFDMTLIDGVWNAETPSLVYDPTDSGAEWKLFVHRIFRQSNNNFTVEQNLPGYSWIGMRTAPSPAGPWSSERALLASGTLPPAPYDVVEVAVNNLDPSLSSMIIYSEPGAFVSNGTLYLSLTGITAAPDRIILLSSSDHGDSWQFLSTLLSASDIATLGFDSVDGSAIVEDAGRFFLLATPEIDGVLHDGTIAIEFDALPTGALKRTGGVPVIHLHIPAQSGLPVDRRGGQADYHEANIVGGLIQPSLQTGLYPKFFTFSSTGLRLVTPPAVPALGGSASGLAFVLTLLGVMGVWKLRKK